MSNLTIMASFGADPVPGPYGEVQYGAGATSAASIPLRLLCMGLKASGAGSAVDDSSIFPIYSQGDADTYFGAGGQLDLMLQGALGIPGVTVFGMSVAPAGGAVAAFITLTIVAAQATGGTYSFRIAGKTMQITIGPSDSATVIALAIRDKIRSFPYLPVTASNSAGVVTITMKSPGTCGNSQPYFHDITLLPSGVTATLTNGGTPITGGGVPLAGGTGTENVTNALAVLNPQHFDRIALGHNDSTNLALWKAQIDAQAGALQGNLQHVVYATNGTLAAATSLAQTTLNHQRFQGMWMLNSETPFGVIAAVMGADRTAFEQADPASAFDGDVLTGIAPQTQKADLPNHPTLVSALNNSVTPITTTPDGNAVVVRSITTRSLNGVNPDYSTRDTGQAVVPDFILTDLKLYWSTVFQPSNPRNADNPLPTERARPAGVATPALWASAVTAKLRAYEQGKIGGTTIAPIIINVDSNLPTAVYDAANGRIALAAPIVVAPANHQTLVSVRQTA